MTEKNHPSHINEIGLLNKQISGDDVVQIFAARGISVNRGTVYDVRGNRTSGKILESKLKMVELLDGSVREKDEFYLHLADVGLEVRTRNSKGDLTPISFSKNIAGETGIPYLNVGRFLRAMRTDMAFTLAQENIPEIENIFRDCAEEYLRSYRQGYEGSPNIRDVDSAWDRGTIGDFYRAFYTFNPTSQMLRSWMPYEVEVLHAFYKHRIEHGSILSPLDRIILERNIKKTPVSSLVENVRLMTGIPFDNVVHFAHTNVLLSGNSETTRRE